MKIQNLILLTVLFFSCHPANAQTANTLSEGKSLKTGEKLTSSNGAFYLIMQTDGNLCIYKTADDGFVWCNMVHGFSNATLIMQGDGNLVIYNGRSQAKWSSKTHPYFNEEFRDFDNKPTKLVLENDASLKLYNASGNAVWSNKEGIIISKNEENPSIATASKAELDAFFNQNGGKDKFSKHYIDALTTMITVEDLVKASRYAEAKKQLDKLWKLYPIGTNLWWNSNSDDKKYKTNIGSPAAYYALRMLTDIVNHNLNTPNPTGEILTATLRVLLVECSEGKQPMTVPDMRSGRGKHQRRSIDPRLKADNYRIIDQSLNVFKRYVTAMTGGKLKIEVKYYNLKDYCAPTKVVKDGTRADLRNYTEVLNRLPKNIKEASDWYWILYPSAVPEDGVDGVAANAGFDKKAFITGGMGAYGKNKPTFIIDDRWLVRVPPHMGKGEMSDIERRAYLPQWLQHEFFHHLYRSYPELKLEVKGHDWFDRKFWAADFEGQFESDYYQETLHKRLKQAKPYLHYMLKPTYKPSEDILNNLNISQFVNKTFDHSEIFKKQGGTPNDWHTAQIIQENGKYYWKNKAGAKWEVVPDFNNAKFSTKSDNPYQGQDFFIAFKQNDSGAFTGEIEGLYFGGGLYQLK
jgi:hypothetical protein